MHEWTDKSGPETDESNTGIKSILKAQQQKKESTNGTSNWGNKSPPGIKIKLDLCLTIYTKLIPD